MGICAPVGVARTTLRSASKAPRTSRLERTLTGNRSRPAMFTAMASPPIPDSTARCTSDRQAVARRLGAVHLDIHVKPFGDFLGKNRPHLRHRRKNLLDACGHLLDTLEI